MCTTSITQARLPNLYSCAWCKLWLLLSCQQLSSRRWWLKGVVVHQNMSAYTVEEKDQIISWILVKLCTCRIFYYFYFYLFFCLYYWPLSQAFYGQEYTLIIKPIPNQMVNVAIHIYVDNTAIVQHLHQNIGTQKATMSYSNHDYFDFSIKSTNSSSKIIVSQSVLDWKPL